MEWPLIADFEARFRLPPSCVQKLTDEFEASGFRPGKGKHEELNSLIPLFHKVYSFFFVFFIAVILLNLHRALLVGVLINIITR